MYKIHFRHLAVIVTILLTSSTPHTLIATPVDTIRAEQVARNFWNSQHDKEVTTLTTPMQTIDTRWDAFYIFTSNEATGFVIVAADDCVQPILGYSFRNPVIDNDANRELAWWLDGYQQQIDYCRSIGAKATDVTADEWKRWEYGATHSASSKASTQLLTTQWNQTSPYNNLCPTASDGSGERAVTGCVATAMAQVMRYWNHPVRGTGTHTYTSTYYGGSSPFGTQSVDFSSTLYDWDNMPNRLNSTSSNTEKNAVATLMYHCGVAVDMIYGTSSQGGSGAFLDNLSYLNCSHTLNGMVNFFGYSSHATAVLRSKYDDAEWKDMVRTELRAGRPVIYAGGDADGGHCFVCDGYANLGYFHFNWGWGGIGDGNFTLNNLAPGTGGVGGGNYCFNDDQEIIIGMQPHADDDSLCIIRQFPYNQDFETAPTCWTAESDHSGNTWRISDPNGVDGNYSAYVSAPYYSSSSNDHLLSPFICQPGQYKLSWQAHSFGSGSNDCYTVSTDTLLLSDTLHSTDWVQRETTFNIAIDDTIRIDFHYTFTTGSTGVMIDHIVIEKLWDATIDNTPTNACRLYPNPTRGNIRIESTKTILYVELLDISGRCLKSSSAQTVDLTNLPAGIYFLRITTPSGTEIQRLVRAQ